MALYLNSGWNKVTFLFSAFCVLQVIPQISSLSWFTTVVPLILVLTVTAAKDATDDIVSTFENVFCFFKAR